MVAFYLDADVTLQLADDLRSRSHSAVTARDVGLDTAADDRQLLAAAQQSSILITHNRRDFVLLHQAWLNWSSAWGVVTPHSGVLVVAQEPADRLAQEVDTFLPLIPSLTNLLYRWRPSQGWERWDWGNVWIPWP